MTTFTKKNIRVTIKLGVGTFSSGGNTLIINDFNDVTEEGLGIKVQIFKKPKPDKNDCLIKIYNLSLQHMEECTNLGFKGTKIQHNKVQIDINNGDGNGYSTLFKGDIIRSYADFTKETTPALAIKALTSGFSALIPAKPMSVKGTTPASQLFSQWANDLGYTFKNNGVTASVKNSIFNGTTLEKCEELAKQIGIDLVIDDNVLFITPKNKPLNADSGQIPYLSAQTGMIGYPEYTSKGIKVRCFCNPNIKQNRYVQIESIVPGISGKWRVSKVAHEITAHTEGKWQTEFEGVKA